MASWDARTQRVGLETREGAGHWHAGRSGRFTTRKEVVLWNMTVASEVVSPADGRRAVISGSHLLVAIKLDSHYEKIDNGPALVTGGRTCFLGQRLDTPFTLT